MTQLKHRSVLLMIVLTLLTLGLYYPIWFLRRRDALNAIDSPRKVAWWPPVLMIAVMTVHLVIRFLAPDGHSALLIGDGPFLLLILARWAAAILLLVQAFYVREILTDAIADPELATMPGLYTQTELSGLLTFFFTIFYLQYVINRDVVQSAAQSSG